MKQKERLKTLISKRIEVQTNYDALKSLCDQIQEEVSMGQEDIAGRLIQKADFVSLREELEAIYDRSFQALGSEFSMYIEASSQPMFRPVYESAKLQVFIRDVLKQLLTQNKFAVEKLKI